MTVKIEFNEWSDESLRSYQSGGSWIYAGSDPESYENVANTCVRCERPFVFTAEEQKVAYEERKEFIWKRIKRCNNCQLELQQLQKKNSEFQSAWNNKDDDLQTNAGFLNEWLKVLELIPLYGKKADRSAIEMLRKALRENI